ncbi:MAG: Crp/Fnr family transcriptional regulator [Synechococcales cyanobacterium]
MSPLLDFPLFAGIPEARLAALSLVITQKTFPSGRALFMEDTWGNVVFLLQSGWVRVRQTSRTGTLTLAVLGPKAMFGEMAILDAVPRSTDVIAITDVQVWLIPASKFQDLLHQENSFTYALARQLAERLRQSNYRRYLQKQSPALRLVAVLVHLFEAFGQGSPPEIWLLSSQDLADLADTTPELVDKGLERLGQEGMVQRDPQKQRLLCPALDRLTQLLQSV